MSRVGKFKKNKLHVSLILLREKYQLLKNDVQIRSYVEFFATPYGVVTYVTCIIILHNHHYTFVSVQTLTQKHIMQLFVSNNYIVVNLV